MMITTKTHKVVAENIKYSDLAKVRIMGYAIDTCYHLDVLREMSLLVTYLFALVFFAFVELKS